MLALVKVGSNLASKQEGKHLSDIHDKNSRKEPSGKYFSGHKTRN